MGLLFLMRRYEELIDQAEFLVIEHPEDTELRYMLAFAYNATGRFESAVRILSTTGQPDTVLEERIRSAADIEGFFALVNALAGVGQADLAGELARYFDDLVLLWTKIPDWWNKAYMACGQAVQKKDEEAQRPKQSKHLLAKLAARQKDNYIDPKV